MQNRIRELREAIGMSQEKLAEAANLSRPFLSTIETGSAVPTVAKAAAIANALGVTISDLFPVAEDGETEEAQRK